MDQLFLELIGKPKLNPPKIITIVAQNFTFLEDQARFLKATLAIPTVKQLPFDNLSKRLIQIGPLQRDIGDQLRKEKWSINQYEDYSEGICDRMTKDLADTSSRSLIFVNDISRLELASADSAEAKQMMVLADRFRSRPGHFTVILYQNSCPESSSTVLRDLEFLSDAMVRVHICKAGYFKSMWWETVPQTRTLIPPKVETSYFTCKIGKFYWSSDLLCFYDRKKVAKHYDLDTDPYLDDNAEDERATVEEAEGAEANSLTGRLGSTKIDDDTASKRREDERDSTLPYTKAQNPQQSQIFYYPDKDDDIDEDDPDNDLNI